MRKFAKVSLAILLVAVLAWASDPWKKKPYQQWNRKDISKVMNDSPWARTIRVTTGFGVGQEMGLPGGAGSQQPRGQGQPTMGGRLGGSPTQGNPNVMPTERTMMFEVRWISALTMRQALARSAILDGKLSQADAERYLAKTPENYQLALFGPNMSIFAGISEATLAKDSYLEIRSTKKKVAPVAVKIEKSPQGRQEALSFEFPKTVNGEPTIGPKEKGVDFVCKAKDQTLKFHFDPRKMTNKQGLDL